ncbi:hypothetical protein [Chryseobacterium gallinarum]|nr:hypothetical protein [Chryseobacterium gallinarum]
MKKIFLLIVLCTGVLFNAQKLKLGDFKLITYDVEPSNNIKIYSYSKIDKQGILSVYLKRSRDEVYYKYQLTEDEIEKINQLSSKKMKDFVVKKQLDKNQGYAGNRNYITFQVGGKKDKLCFINPFMDAGFNNIINLLKDKIYKQDDLAKSADFTIDFESAKKEIITQDEIDNYLPQKQLPPPPMKVVK